MNRLLILLSIAWLIIAAGAAQAYDVVILASSSYKNDVHAQLNEVYYLEAVDLHDASSSTPSLAELQAYDSVLVFSDDPFHDSVALGDTLADYLESGGGVVVATFAFDPEEGIGIAGRFVTDGLAPFTTGTSEAGIPLTLEVIDDTHPVTKYVDTLDGGSASYHHAGISVADGFTTLANWSNGEPLVAAQEFADGAVVGLNFFPPSSDAHPDFWDSRTDGDRLMAHALHWAAPGTDYDYDGWTYEEGDCDDYNANINPDATEVPYNGLDDDCDGSDLDDLDGDGFPGGYVGEDCDDMDPEIHPAAEEDCSDAVDNDCDELIDAMDPDCEGDDPDVPDDSSDDPGSVPNGSSYPQGCDSCQCSVDASRPLSWVVVALLSAVALSRRRGER